MLENLKRIIVITGHYGSGKTNLSVNLAIDLKKAGKQVVLADLDIVNPYFRSADFRPMLEQKGIEMITPLYAGSNLDIPALTAHLDMAITTEKTLVIDVGGDESGAVALGRYSNSINRVGGCDMLYVVNMYRYLTQNSDEADSILDEIERTSRLKVTGVVNNSNLANETTPLHVMNSMNFARESATKRNLPLCFTAADSRISAELGQLMPSETVYPVDIYVKKLWEV